MFQPGLRATDVVGANGAITLQPTPVFGRARALVQQPRISLDLHGLDGTVDLGRDIGSGAWWRGLITLALLCGSAAYLGARVQPMPQPNTPAYTEAQQIEAGAQAIAPLAMRSATGRRFAAGAHVKPLSETPERPRIELAATMGTGSNFATTLRRSGASEGDAKMAADLVASTFPLNQIKGGTVVDLVLGRRPDKSVARPLESLEFRAAFDLRLAISRVGGELRLKRIPIAVDDTPMRITGTVGGSLYRAARASGVPANLVADFIKALSFGIDFQRDVPSSAKFDIIFEHRLAETGETQVGKLLYAGLDRSGKKLQMMRWSLGGREQFFDASGEATQKGLMRTPVDGARLTSGFGMRLHPLLGYSRMHRGVDFGAPSGSPILAAAAGRVEYAGWHGGHGKYVKINHGNGLATAYGHMSGFAVSSGQTVRQGQVIGYVGSTGMSTGPHLHYELWRNGQAVDPRSVKFTSRTQLAGKDLGAFKAKLGTLMHIKVGAKSGPAQSAATEAAKGKARS